MRLRLRNTFQTNPLFNLTIAISQTKTLPKIYLRLSKLTSNNEAVDQEIIQTWCFHVCVCVYELTILMFARLGVKVA